MYEQEEPLHSKISVYNVLDKQRWAMLENIKTLTERQAKSKTPDELAYAFSHEFQIDVPVLDETAIKPTKREIDIDLSQDRMRANYGFGSELPRVVKGTEIAISVPFSGDREVFRVHANSHTMNYPLGKITSNTIIFTQSGQNLDGAKVRAEFYAWLLVIRGHLINIRRDIGNFNETLKIEALKSIEERLAKFGKDNSLLDSLGF